MASKTPYQGNRDERRSIIGKYGGFSVGRGLRDQTQLKSIGIKNVYAALNHTESLENENNHIMVKVKLPRNRQEVFINAMIDSEATEDLIDKDIFKKYHIERNLSLIQREINLADGKSGTMRPNTHIATIPREICTDRE